MPRNVSASSEAIRRNFSASNETLRRSTPTDNDEMPLEPRHPLQTQQLREGEPVSFPDSFQTLQSFYHSRTA